MTDIKQAIALTRRGDKLAWFNHIRSFDMHEERSSLVDEARYYSMDENIPLVSLSEGTIQENLFIINPDNVEIIVMSLRFVKEGNKNKPEFTTLYHGTMEYNEEGYFYLLQVIYTNRLDDCRAYDTYELAMAGARDIVAHHPDSHVAVHKIHKTCGTIGKMRGQYDSEYDYIGKSVDEIYQRVMSRVISEVTAYDPDHKRWYTVMWNGNHMAWDMSYNKLKANYDKMQSCSYGPDDAPGDPLRWTMCDSTGWWYYPSDYDLHPELFTMLEE